MNNNSILNLFQEVWNFFKKLSQKGFIVKLNIENEAEDKKKDRRRKYN